MRFTIFDLRFTIGRSVAVFAFVFSSLAHGESVLLYNATVHTVSGATLTNGAVLIQNEKIGQVGGSVVRTNAPADAKQIDLQGQHLYPGLIALDSALGLVEISAVRATQDTAEVGDYTPDVESWIAVNPDSELLPVARANGIAYFEPVPKGNIAAGQSALLSMDGWTYEQMALKKPAALHLFWPSMALNTVTKERSADPAKWKSLEDQGKERRARLQSLAEFLEEAKAYVRAKDAFARGQAAAPEKIPAWEALTPYVRGELPIVIHADEVRQIRSAVNWAATNQFKMILAGGYDSWMVADLLATNRIPVIYEHVYSQPARNYVGYDTQFATPETLRRAGVTVLFSVGPDPFATPMSGNLPYSASQAIAFGYPADEALKGITLYPAQLMGVADRIGSIETGKDATLIVTDGNLFDLRTSVKRMWIAGKEVNLDNRHQRLYEKYRNRPKN
jgi:imidazolonepropionase-like amidohydrolase